MASRTKFPTVPIGGVEADTNRRDRLRACGPILTGYSAKRSNRHFLRAILLRSMSIVNHTIVRHGFSIPKPRSLATGRWARGLHRNTSGYRAAIEFVLTSARLRRIEFSQGVPHEPWTAASCSSWTNDSITFRLVTVDDFGDLGAQIVDGFGLTSVRGGSPDL
jgi:hypothetical protein